MTDRCCETCKHYEALQPDCGGWCDATRFCTRPEFETCNCWEQRDE